MAARSVGLVVDGVPYEYRDTGSAREGGQEGIPGQADTWTRPAGPSVQAAGLQGGGGLLHSPGRKNFPKAWQRQAVVGLGEAVEMEKVPGLPEATPDQEEVVGGDQEAVDTGEVKRGPVGETLGKPGLVVMGGDPGKAEGLGVEMLSVVPGEKGPVTVVEVETLWVVPVEEGPVRVVEV